MSESHRLVLGADGPVVIVPTELLQTVEHALLPVIDRTRGSQSPLARPIADLFLAIREARHAAQIRTNVANSGRATASRVDNDTASPHRDERARELSIDEAARRIGRSPRHVRRLALAGKLPGVRKVGGRWVVDEDAMCGALGFAS